MCDKHEERFLCEQKEVEIGDLKGKRREGGGRSTRVTILYGGGERERGTRAQLMETKKQTAWKRMSERQKRGYREE